LVERVVWDHEVAGSNPVTPILAQAHVFGLRPEKQQDWEALCRFLRSSVGSPPKANAGESRATKHDLPWILIHEEKFPTRAATTARERYFKTGRGRDELDQLHC
jgi:hypothetical protein